MRYPCLVPQWSCKCDYEIIPYTDEVGEDGEPIELDHISGKCNFQEISKLVRSEQKEDIQLHGVALFPGELSLKKGKLIIFNQEHDIHSVTLNRNIDGTVNYTKIEVI